MTRGDGTGNNINKGEIDRELKKKKCRTLSNSFTPGDHISPGVHEPKRRNSLHKQQNKNL